MNSNSSVSSRPLWPALVRTSLSGIMLLGLAALANMACSGNGNGETNWLGENSGIGRSCNLMADAGPTQAVYNAQALECPSGICLKPTLNTMRDYETGSYCSELCSRDSDCQGQQRDGNDPNDKRCTSGYACGVAFVVGPLCCKKVCLCKDFLSEKGVTVPLTCDPSANGGKTACAENQ
jgi:hypothetical protein